MKRYEEPENQSCSVYHCNSQRLPKAYRNRHPYKTTKAIGINVMGIVTREEPYIVIYSLADFT